MLYEIYVYVRKSTSTFHNLKHHNSNPNKLCRFNVDVMLSRRLRD